MTQAEDFEPELDEEELEEEYQDDDIEGTGDDEEELECLIQ